MAVLMMVMSRVATISAAVGDQHRAGDLTLFAIVTVFARPLGKCMNRRENERAEVNAQGESGGELAASKVELA